MAISFGDSLKASKKTNQIEKVVAVDVPQVAAYATRSVSADPVAIAENTENWIPVSDKGYDFYDDYNDDDYSVVDVNKNITLNSSQINITQETNSQYIPFIMPRYYDGFDLSSTKLQFFYVNRLNSYGIDYPVNVYYNDDQLKFAWLVDDSATAVDGKLKFELQAVGVNSRGESYTWKSKANESMTVLKSLTGTKMIEPSETWKEDFLTVLNGRVAVATDAAAEAKSAIVTIEALATRAESAAADARAVADNLMDGIHDDVQATVESVIDSAVDGKISGALLNYYDRDTVDELLNNIDISDQLKEVKDQIANLDGLANFNVEYDGSKMRFFNGESVMNEIEINSDPTEEWTNIYTKSVEEKIELAASNLQKEILNLDSNVSNNYYKKTETYNQNEIDVKLSNVTVDLTGYATEKYVDDKTANFSSTILSNTKSIESLSKTLGDLQNDVGEIDNSPRLTYDVSYNDVEDVDVGENVFVLYEITGEGTEDEVREVKKRFTITGGSGPSSSSSLKIHFVTVSPVIATINEKALIKYNFSGTDSSGDDVMEGTYTWKVGSKVIATGIAVNGENEFDATPFASTTAQTFTLSITDEAGGLVSKSWKVQLVDLRIESSFNDAFPVGNGDFSFSYTPYGGSIEKEIHFILDGKELGVVKTSTSGIPMSYPIPSQTHGAHLLEVYMTANINGKTIGIEDIVDENGEVIGHNHTIKIVKDILWCDNDSNVPIIGCATQIINVMQHSSINIKYAVIDPSTETPKVIWKIGDDVLSEETLSEKDEFGYYTFPYKASSYGSFVLTILCGNAEPKAITINVERLNINVSPVMGGLAFDFNPVGYSNSSSDRLWSSNNVTMDVSPNFDWVNGGYQIDENGDQYFCVKAGTYALINYNLFADDPKQMGKEFKVIFRTKNIRKRDTSFLTCIDSNIGIDMKVEYATVSDSGGSLRTNYCEDSIVEYEFNIHKNTEMMIVMTYEDGTPSKPYEYKETSSFRQPSPKPIKIGSEDCDVFIYRIKAYSTSLTDTDIKNNFIADARNADEIIARYTRNLIYNEDGRLVSTTASGDFSAEALMKAAPELRYIFLEVPQFTNDKDNKIDGCTVHFRYPAGKRPQDNWTCTGVRHRGQGTSSNEYGYSGRNIDLCMDRDESLFTWVDEEGNTVESSTITLTDTSVPTDYLNIKVNIASSENANNAQLARRFNEYQPFLRYARKKDSRVKDTMEFYNCVVFIRETSTDLSNTPHREFNDTDWHFYAIGNVGDSKKTDDTRVNNKRDPKEHIIEITDADKPLSAFPTGKDANSVCPIEEWCEGNTAYDILHSTEYVYDKEGAFESFGGATYEFRYEMKDITEEQREENINAWRDLYKFIVTSTDEEFYTNLKNYFVVDSALYFYLFTERYTMVDNRAKNSFWHYGKVYISNEEAVELGEIEASYYIVDDVAAAINNGYRYDLTQGYDMDTALGIDNTGDYVFSYGKEDTDYYIDGDPTSDYVFRVANSVFFCRLRDLFPSEMQAMFKNREEKNAWSSTSLIDQWDRSQAQFPEELWRLDYERKYYRTYLGLSIDNSIPKGRSQTFLIGKFFGRKKYARRSFELNQEIYFATKYFGNKALSDRFYIRGNFPIGSSIAPNYSLTLVPYSDMYVCVQYTSTGSPIHSMDENGKPRRVKAGETVRFENDAERMDFIYVFAASYIQEVGDLSRCYIGDNDFSSATRLQKLVIGSTTEGYENTFMKEVLVANNQLLEHLDLRNVSGINTVIDVSGCSNLKELYAEGTNATGAIFANGGMLEVAHLPALTSLSMKNLNYINDFVIGGYDKLQTLIIENTPNVNTYEIVSNAPALRLLRLIGINWDFVPKIENAEIFNRILKIGGIDSSGYETDLSILTGIASVSVIKEYDHRTFKEAWPDLNISPVTVRRQFPVTFINDDGSVIEIQYVVEGEKPVDPTKRQENRIIPQKESSVSHDFTFDKWDSELTNVFGEKFYRAIYTETLREYSIRYVSMGEVLQESKGLYGQNIRYEGNTPVYTDLESAFTYYLFSRWDNSGFIDGEKTVNAVFDRFKYTGVEFDDLKLWDMSPVQIYALTKLSAAKILTPENNILKHQDYFQFNLGNDIEFDDIRSEVIISEPMKFTGAADSHIDTGIKLFDEDKDFVIAIDYELLDGNSNNAVIAQCYRSSTVLGINGLKLWYSSSAGTSRLSWGSSNQDIAAPKNREIVVIRHTKGSNNVMVYNSNIGGNSVVINELSHPGVTLNDESFVLGCAKVGSDYENHAICNINWCKIWYKDLGENACMDLAAWVHEPVKMEVCSFKKYFLTDDPTQRCTFSMLAANLIGRSVKWGTNNTGGWNGAYLNAYLNSRVYSALPIQIRSIIKKVSVISTAGNKSKELIPANCYIAIPAYNEVENVGSDPYIGEGETIPYMINVNSAPGENVRKRADSNGVYKSYWLRSPNANYSYVWTVNQDGDPYGYSDPSSLHNILIMLSF